jgi:TRAP transporter TAXI family solute receptor
MKIQRIVSLVAFFAMVLSFSATALADKYFKMDGISQGGSYGTIATAFSNTAHKYADGITIQVSMGKPGVRSVIDAAAGRVDFYMFGPSLTEWLRNGERMFKKIENPAEKFARLRTVVMFPAGAYHALVYADSGIKTFHDLKGKKVWIGPKNGAITVVNLAVIEGASGLKPGKDFTVVNLDGRAGMQAFQDRQVDFLMAPSSTPSPMVAQIALINKIRLLDLPEAALKHPKIAPMLKLPGRTMETIQPDVYGKNQVNEKPVRALGVWSGIGTHVGVDAEGVYQTTKAFWEHIDELYSVAAWTKAITRETALNEANMPLHKGAYRYYKEAGFKIPAHLVPSD